MKQEGIDLPADIIWLDDGRLGVAIVQGDERRPDWWDESSVEFVAPQAWAQHDKLCRRRDHDALMARMIGEACPDCRDGRQVWTVRWPCDEPSCGEYEVGYVDYEWQDTDSGGVMVIDLCPECDGVGHLSARATIQVVPVVDGDTVPGASIPPDGVYVSKRLGKAWLDSEFEHDLPFDPLPTPGRDWTVIVRVISHEDSVDVGALGSPG